MDFTKIRESIEKIIGNRAETMFDEFLVFGKNVLIAILLLIIGFQLIKWIVRIIKKALERGRIETTVSKFLISLSNIAMKGFLLIMVATVVGVPETAFIALLGSVGLTIGLAFQGSLSNFAGGVILLIMKPFKVGDYIKDVGTSNEGTVTSIDIFYTTLNTVDNKVITIPNGSLTNSSVINYSKENLRRVDLIISVAYTEQISNVKAILEEIVKENEKILFDIPYIITVVELSAISVDFAVRVWTNNAEYWNLRAELLENIKTTFDHKEISIAVNPLGQLRK
jgi:small conductance mechanosensitive channel